MTKSDEIDWKEFKYQPIRADFLAHCLEIALREIRAARGDDYALVLVSELKSLAIGRLQGRLPPGAEGSISPESDGAFVQALLDEFGSRFETEIDAIARASKKRR